MCPCRSHNHPLMGGKVSREAAVPALLSQPQTCRLAWRRRCVVSEGGSLTGTALAA